MEKLNHKRTVAMLQLLNHCVIVMFVHSSVTNAKHL